MLLSGIRTHPTPWKRDHISCITVASNCSQWRHAVNASTGDDMVNGGSPYSYCLWFTYHSRKRPTFGYRPRRTTETVNGPVPHHDFWTGSGLSTLGLNAVPTNNPVFGSPSLSLSLSLSLAESLNAYRPGRRLLIAIDQINAQPLYCSLRS
jgi:hypothetical protein